MPHGVYSTLHATEYESRGKNHQRFVFRNEFQSLQRADFVFGVFFFGDENAFLYLNKRNDEGDTHYGAAQRKHSRRNYVAPQTGAKILEHVHNTRRKPHHQSYRGPNIHSFLLVGAEHSGEKIPGVEPDIPHEQSGYAYTIYIDCCFRHAEILRRPRAERTEQSHYRRKEHYVRLITPPLAFRALHRSAVNRRDNHTAHACRKVNHGRVQRAVIAHIVQKR